MSSEGPATSPADSRQDSSASDTPRPSDDPRVLREEIERTREQLGATVEALAAKADVKSQAKQKASQLTGRLTSQAGQLRQRATEAATNISKITPKPVKQAAGNAAATARRYRIPLTVGTAGAAVLGWLLINRKRRR